MRITSDIFDLSPLPTGSEFGAATRQPCVNTPETFRTKSVPGDLFFTKTSGCPNRMSRLKYDRIPIWENKRRIKDLTFWRDLWLEGTFPSPKTLLSPTTGKPFSMEERRSELNRRIPAVREMVALAEIPTVRDWMTVRKDPKPVRVDILEQFWYYEQLWLSFQAPSDVVDEAIGKYQSDQRRSWIRTFNPFYWIGRGIDWLVSEAFNVVKIFGGNPETARGSRVGRVIIAIGQFIGWIAGILVAIVTVLWFLGLDKPVRNYLGLP